MKKKSIISVLFALLCVMFISGAVDNEKALALIKKGNESYQAQKIPSRAFAYFTQAAGLASGPVKVDALLKAAYMSHLQGNKVTAFQDLIKDALKIDPEKKLDTADYRASFRQIFSDIKSREKITAKPAVTKTAAKTIAPQAQPPVKKEPARAPLRQKPLRAKTARRSNYFIKISYAMGLAGSDQTQSWTEPLYGENTEYSLASTMGTSSNIHAGFGCNFGKSMGVGLGAILLSGDIDATVNASVPSPWRFDSPRSASGAYAATLKSTIFYLNFIYTLPLGKLGLDLFAGPAYFSSSTEVISSIAIQDVFPNDTVSISLATEKVKKTGFGFNAGLDLDYFFSSNLGVFLEGRYLSGSTTFAPASQQVPGIKLNAGGLNVGAGLVFRF
jgi:hypothetical protein